MSFAGPRWALSARSSFSSRPGSAKNAFTSSGAASDLHIARVTVTASGRPSPSAERCACAGAEPAHGV
jgi:hypothetical protein